MTVRVIMRVVMPDLRRALPVFTPHNRPTVGAKLTIHLSLTVFRLLQPFHQSCNDLWMGVQIRRDDGLNFRMARLMVGYRRLHLLNQSASQ